MNDNKQKKLHVKTEIEQQIHSKQLYLKLAKAVNNNDLISVKKLVEKGADFNLNSGNVLIKTVELNDLNILKYFIETGFVFNEHIESVFGIASRVGRFFIMKYLIEKKLVSISDIIESLIINSECGAIDIVQYLYEALEDKTIVKSYLLYNCKEVKVKAWFKQYLNSETLHTHLNTNLPNFTKSINSHENKNKIHKVKI